MLRTWGNALLSLGFLLSVPWVAIAQKPDSTNTDPCSIVPAFVQAALAGNSLTNFLSPSLEPGSREKEIALTKKKFLALEIYNYDCGQGLQLRSADHADLRADVHWSTTHSDFRQTVTLHLVRVNGQWYFVDFDFLAFNWTLALAGSAVAVVWAGFLVTWFRDWRKRHFSTRLVRAGWAVVLFIPFLGVVAYWLFVRRAAVVQG
jgi:hypothetical protein